MEFCFAAIHRAFFPSSTQLSNKLVCAVGSGDTFKLIAVLGVLPFAMEATGQRVSNTSAHQWVSHTSGIFRVWSFALP
jgi:hypothetical protein